jgi:hypothetical protein
MFAYDFLKQDVKNNSDMLIYNWERLYLDKNVTYSVKQEVKELHKKGLPLKDSVLYWHKHVVLLPSLVVNDSNKRQTAVNRLLDYKLQDYTEFLGSRFCDYMYSLAKYKQYYTNAVCVEFIKAIVNYDWRHKTLIQNLNELDITFAEFKQVVDLYVAKPGHNIINYVPAVIVNGCYTKLITNAYTYSQLAQEIYDIITHSTRNLFNYLRKLDSQEVDSCIDNISMLLKDCGDIKGIRFNSINEIRLRHDMETAKATEELMAKAGKNKYVYRPEFKQLVKESATVYLPQKPADLVLRGAQHHNCVATYTNRHTDNCYTDNKNRSGFVSRILFTENATCELEFELYDGNIISTKVLQYKGAFNKNLQPPLSLYVLRMHLVGKPAEIIVVSEVNDD